MTILHRHSQMEHLLKSNSLGSWHRVMLVWWLQYLEQNSWWLSGQASPLWGSLQHCLQLERLRFLDLMVCSVLAVYLALILCDTSIICKFHCNRLFQATDKTSLNSHNCLQRLPHWTYLRTFVLMINFAARTSWESLRQQISTPGMSINIFKCRN